MGNIIKKVQRETLTYWAPDPINPTNEFGEPNWLAPREYTCRWDDKVQQIQLADRSYVLSRCELITEVQLAVGGFVMLGTLNQITDWTVPKNNPGAYELIKVSRTPDIKNRRQLFEAWA